MTALTTKRKTRINRRRFLAVSAGGAAVLAIAGVGIGLQPTVVRSPRRELKALTPRGFSILAAVADRICPGTGELPSAWELEVPEDVDAFLASCHPGVAAEVTQGLLLVENGLPGLIFDGRPRPFTARSAAQQHATLHDMQASRLELRRTLYKALHGLVGATYWGNPAVFSHCGYVQLDYSGFGPPEPEPEPDEVVGEEEAP